MRKTLALSLALSGCFTYTNSSEEDLSSSGGKPDLTFSFTDNDLAGGGNDLAGGLNECGDVDPTCTDIPFGPSHGMLFPDKNDPNAILTGLSIDKDGYLALDSGATLNDTLWAANTGDAGNRGTVSKFNTKTVREIARYLSVTCNSTKTGGPGNCDGVNGCCALDSYPQFQNRKANMPSGPSQQVLMSPNYPSRTAVDLNGDMFISNRAFGGQSSISKIADDPSRCIDRNANGKIDTSRDVNTDGVIQVDCNNNMVPDDLNDVKNAPCQNGLAQEFYGLDDECVLWTTNTDTPNNLGRPLGLAPGAQGSDPWAGLYQNGHFYRIDGNTGITKDFAQLPNGCMPYGLVVDSSGIGWSDTLGMAPLCWFNTKNANEVGKTRTPSVGQEQPYGIALDRDQNIWLACLQFGVCRYTPNRKNGVTELGNGFWTMISTPGKNQNGGFTIGIAVDSRTANDYWAFAAGNSVMMRMPASQIPLPNGADVLIDGSNYPTVPIAGDGKGVGVDRDQNVWNVSGQGKAGITRVKVDAMGTMTAPDIVSQPMGNNLCPAGDHCGQWGNNPWDPAPYTYSDFTGFGLRNFTKPRGLFSYLLKGCGSGETTWLAIRFDADVPLNTALTVRAHAGKTPTPDNTWGGWTNNFSTSPANLVAGMPLVPNMKDAPYLQIAFDLTTTQAGSSPRLKGFDVLYECK